MRPIQNGCAQRSRLRHQCQLSGISTALVKGGIKPGRRAHDSQAVGTNKAQTIAARTGKNLRFQVAPRLADFTKTCRKNDCVANAAPTALLDDRRHRARRRGNHCQINSVADVIEVTVASLPLHHVVFGVDRKQRALEAGVQQIVHDHSTNRAFAVAGTEQSDGFRFKQGLEIMFHIESARVACSKQGH